MSILTTKPIIDCTYADYSKYPSVPNKFKTRFRVWPHGKDFFTREEYIYPGKKGPSKIFKQEMNLNELIFFANDLYDKKIPVLHEIIMKLFFDNKGGQHS